MKQSLKYGLLVVLVWLLHSVTMNAADTTLPASTEFAQEECFLSQAHSVSNAFQRLHIHYSEMLGEMSHAEESHLFLDKSCTWLASCFREHKVRNNRYSDYLLHPIIDTSSDPVSYYVFGLRKIII